MRGALKAAVAGLSLTHTVGKAALAGIFTTQQPFLRTPKCEDPAQLGQALRVVWQEASLFLLCMLGIAAMLFLNDGLDDPAAILWMVMLSVQSLPYAATVTTAALSAASNAKLARVVTMPAMPPPEPEPLAKAA
jgi:hypothetical protein